jgi:hypothetical protein
MEYAAVYIAFVHKRLLKMHIFQKHKMLGNDNEFLSENSAGQNVEENGCGD